MKFVSTRGLADRMSFEEAVLAGFASDGGLVVPEHIPVIDISLLSSWSSLSYTQLAKTIVPLYIDESDIPRKDLLELLDASFGQGFDKPEVVSMVQLKSNVSIMEMFYGPTLAFKDLAMSFVGRLFQYLLNRSRQRCTVIVATSGDTGSAAIEAVKGQKLVDVVVLLPRGHCTRTQELQMTTAIDDNVHVFRCNGSNDDLEEPFAKCFADAEFVRRHRLCSINSINWLRVLVQIVHYFYAYFRMRPNCAGEVEIVVPTGGCGNVAAGCIARKMGLPIRLVSAVNSNDIVARLVDTGILSLSGPVQHTLACSMDILVAYNVERLLWLFSEMDTTFVRKCMMEFEQRGRSTIPDSVHHKMRETLRAHVASDDDIKETMRRCFGEHHYVICPHTATALHHVYTSSEATSSGIPRVCLATASPAKFKDAMTLAGLDPVTSPRLDQLESRPTRYIDLEQGEDWTTMLKQYIETLTAQRTAEAEHASL